MDGVVLLFTSKCNVRLHTTKLLRQNPQTEKVNSIVIYFIDLYALPTCEVLLITTLHASIFEYQFDRSRDEKSSINYEVWHYFNESL